MTLRRAAALLALLLLTAASPSPAVTDIQPIPLHSGVNQVEHLAPDGRPGLIVLGWRDNGNAWGYDLYVVLLPDKTGWQVVGFDRANRDLGHHPDFADAGRDAPHTGEDVIRAVRFARGQVAGRPAVLLLEASRDWTKGVDSPYDPAPTAYDVYALTTNEDGVGYTAEYFKHVARRDLSDRYCHAEKALSAASGLPLRPGYEGKDTPTGC